MVRPIALEPNAEWSGHEVVLAARTYRGGVEITRGGTPHRPVVIRGAEDGPRPRIVPIPGVGFLVDVRANDVVLRHLAFAPTARGVHAIILRGVSRVTVEDCEFEGIGGLSVVETMNGSGSRVSRNRFLRCRATPLYFGCHSGSCAVTDLVVEGNYIHGVRSPDVGYGMQLKLDSSGIIRDNVVIDTKGPAIMIYGARGDAGPTVIERNFAAGSRRSSGIVVGGGPAIIRNNIAVGNAEAGIALEDYDRRGLLSHIEVCHNTVSGNRRGGIAAAPTTTQTVLLNNLVHARWRRSTLPRSRSGLRVEGNAVGDATTFIDSRRWNFSPRVALPGVVVPNVAAPHDDYFGRSRGTAPVVGAVESPATPIVAGFKPARGLSGQTA